MQLKDIANMENYLQNDCYCPGEIYDSTGFFFRVFEAEESCKLLIDGSYKDEKVTAVLCKDQILCFWIDGKKITDAVRYDATENNVKEIVEVLSGKKSKMKVDEFEEGKTKKSLDELMSIADFVIRD
ncbi:MAG: hypothetical protein IJZ79_03730 [Bacilli bacterium]|nr:hypothetical protein [Bacilli bacterium]MBQ8218840.1 hypothetical protein [Bacilli bacterium]